MKLNQQSIQWALEHLKKESDTDLFPKPVEIDIMYDQKDALTSILENIDIGSYVWNPYRRFIIPKGELSYRIVTQLNPIDSVFMSAIIYEYGQLIEQKRIPLSENRVFSYRFSPDTTGELYANQHSWREFWSLCINKAQNYGCIACLDISDFYNQIYHHTVENMLIDVGFPNEVKKSIMNLLEYLTQTVSRGVPIGPHFSHLIAEMSLIPIDESMLVHGINFCRYADDIIIFAKDDKEARANTYKIAEIIDRQQRLILQRQKTRIYSNSDFIEYSASMLKDNPLDIQESEMLEVINKYSNNDPYARIPHNNLTTDERMIFSKEKVTALIEKYLLPVFPDYPRLRWLFRRLTQIGVGEAVSYCVENMDILIPAISDVCQYLISASDNYTGEWQSLGNKVIELLDSELFKANEFFQITLLNLFVCNTKLNHIQQISSMYSHSSENMKRKVILFAFNNKAVSFIRELKETYPSMNDWNRRAYIICCSILPHDERKHFLKYAKSFLSPNNHLEKVLLEWSISQ